MKSSCVQHRVWLFTSTVQCSSWKPPLSVEEVLSLCWYTPRLLPPGSSETVRRGQQQRYCKSMTQRNCKFWEKRIPCSSWPKSPSGTASMVSSVSILECEGDSTRAELTHFYQKSSISPKSRLYQRGDSSVPQAGTCRLFLLRRSVKYLLFLYQQKFLSYTRPTLVSEAVLW